MFQDDVMHTAKGVNEARIANNKINTVVKRQHLQLNKDNTVCLVMGSNKQAQKVWSEMESEPLMYGDFETNMKSSFWWLGQILSLGGLAESVAATVEAREGKIPGACLEISRIVNN